MSASSQSIARLRAVHVPEKDADEELDSGSASLGRRERTDRDVVSVRIPE